jgi:hypothetical protein
VLPEAPASSAPSETLYLQASVVITSGSLLSGAAEKAQGWRDFELEAKASSTRTLLLSLGHDVCDPTQLSGLMNLAAEHVGPEQASAYWSFALNEYHLFNRVADADAYRELLDRRVPEHAPFCVIRIECSAFE